MPDLWMPGAIRADVGDHAPCDEQYPAKAIAHITWDRNATAAKPQDLVPFADLKSYFSGDGSGMAPHILWDPFEGRFAQFYPADSRSKSVVDLAGGTRTNRAGKVVLQIEALFFPYCRYGGKTYASLAETPCKGWAELNAWVRSWGVLDTWPMGRPVSFEPHRDESVWETCGGWYGHSQTPENKHQDPGSWPAFVTAPVQSAQEDDMPLMLNKPNATDALLSSGVWTSLAFVGTAPIHGPSVRQDTKVTLYFDLATDPETRIAGHFFLVDADGVSNKSDFLTENFKGGGGHTFVCSSDVPEGKTLRFEACALSPDGAPVKLLHRQATGPYWAL